MLDIVNKTTNSAERERAFWSKNWFANAESKTGKRGAMKIKNKFKIRGVFAAMFLVGAMSAFGVFFAKPAPSAHATSGGLLGNDTLAVSLGKNENANVFYSYLNAGEKLYVKAIYNPNMQGVADATGMIAKIYAPDGSVAGTCTVEGGATLKPYVDNGKYCDMEITAATDGIYQASTATVSGGGGMNYEIAVRDAGGAEIPGRTWANSLSVQQGCSMVQAYNNGANTATPDNNFSCGTLGNEIAPNIDYASGTPQDLHFYAVNDAGNIYKVDLWSYNGYSSTIALDAAGNVTTAGTCTSAYTSQGNGGVAGDPAHLAKSADCTKYRLFFDAPNSDLPVEATSKDGILQILPVAPHADNTPLANLVPTLSTDNLVSGLTFAESATAVNKAGALTLNIAPAFAGNYQIQVDVNNNGSYDDAVDRDFRASAPGGAANQNVTATFDGKDGQGNDISPNSTIKFRVKFDRIAETHLTLYDDEVLGGLTMTMMNSSVAGTAAASTVYWNDTDLATCAATTTVTNNVCYGATAEPFNMTPQIDGRAGVNSAASGGVHGWEQVFEVREGLLTSLGWGDNRYIDTWVHLSTESASNLSVTAEPMYVVKFVSNGGSQPTQQKVPADGTGKASSATSSRSGYTFGGWKTTATDAANNGGANYNFGSVVNGDMTLYAAWEAKIFAIHYFANDGDGNMSDTPATYDANAQTSSNGFSRTGWTFTGWNTKADGSGNSFANNYEFAPYQIAGDTSLYAQWSRNSYIVSFDNNCADDATCSENPADETAAYEGEIPAPTDPTRDGYTFDYYYVCGDETETAFDFANTTMPAENIQLCAKWAINNYEVKFVDPDDNVLATDTVDYGDGATAPTPPNRDGQRFIRWDKTFDKITGNLIVTAIYEDLPNEPVVPGAPNTGMKLGHANSFFREFAVNRCAIFHMSSPLKRE